MRIEQARWTASDGWEPKTGFGGLGASAQLVLVFGGAKAFFAGKCLDKLKATYPNAHICGCSSARELQGRKVSRGSIAATALAFEHARVAVKRVSIKTRDQSHNAGLELAAALDAPDLRQLIVVSDYITVDGSDLIRGINAGIPSNVGVGGGIAADDNLSDCSLVWCDGEPQSDSVAGIGFYGERLQTGVAAVGGWDPFGPDRLITRSKDNVLYEFDGRSALAVYREYLGEYMASAESGDAFWALQLCVGDKHERVVRGVLSVNEEDHSIVFAGDIPEGAYARMMIGNRDHLIDGAHDAAVCSLESLGAAKPEFALVVSCKGRALTLKQRVEEELDEVADVLGADVPLSGFYSHGEIAPSISGGKAELHNQTIAVICFAET
jgi:hypothetical protein